MRTLLLSLALVGILLPSMSLARPCDLRTAGGALADADLVVEGIAESIEEAEKAPGKFYATLKVTKLIKGDVKGNVKVLSQNASSGGGDSVVFKKGRKYLVHARDEGYVGYTTYFGGCRWVKDITDTAE